MIMSLRMAEPPRERVLVVREGAGPFSPWAAAVVADVVREFSVSAAVRDAGTLGPADLEDRSAVVLCHLTEAATRYVLRMLASGRGDPERIVACVGIGLEVAELEFALSSDPPAALLCASCARNREGLRAMGMNVVMKVLARERCRVAALRPGLRRARS